MSTGQETSASKPDCYKCAFRRDLAGDAHSSCHHPAFAEVHTNPLANLQAIFASVRRAHPLQVTSDECKVTGSPHGIRMGWFNHPMNFDPVWLQSCTGFKERT